MKTLLKWSLALFVATLGFGTLGCVLGMGPCGGPGYIPAFLALLTAFACIICLIVVLIKFTSQKLRSNREHPSATS